MGNIISLSHFRSSKYKVYSVWKRLICEVLDYYQLNYGVTWVKKRRKRVINENILKYILQLQVVLTTLGRF